MIISIVNLSGIADAEVQQAIRAINRQLQQDFAPYWGIQASLRLEGKSQTSPDKLGLPDLRGDAVLYLWNQVDLPDAIGYHDANGRGIPYGFVFTDLAAQLGESWTVTLSHEAMELAADPLVNLLVAGPHPTEDRTVFHWYEMSDAVQGESYVIDDVEVSNFVLPLYFTPTAEPGSRNDFLGTVRDGETLASFGINPGGYIGFFDPALGKHVTYAMKDDARAQARLAAKQRLSGEAAFGGRRALRIGGWPRDQSTAADAAGVRAQFAARPPAHIQARGIDLAALAVTARSKRQFAELTPR